MAVFANKSKAKETLFEPTNIMIPIRKPAPIISSINNKSNSQFLCYVPKKAPLKMIYFAAHRAMILYNLIKISANKSLK